MKRYNSVYEGVYTKPNEMVEEPNGDWVRWEDVQREYHSEWVTDRMPTSTDGIYVYDQHGQIEHHSRIGLGQPWKPIPKCEPYVKPKRYIVREFGNTGQWFVVDVRLPNEYRGFAIPTREAAERIAAIYEEVMP